MYKFIWRIFGIILIIVLAISWILIDANPALAQQNTINYTYADLEGKDFSNQNLVGSSFAAANMRNISFRNANLTGAIMTEGVLLKADLTNANLTRALIDRVTFDFSDLTNAIFVEAIAIRTRFYDTIITGADFTDAVIDRYQVKLMCEKADGINTVTGVATRDSLGCE